MKRIILGFVAVCALSGCGLIAKTTDPLSKERACMRYRVKLALKADLSNPTVAENLDKVLASMGCNNGG